MTAIFFFAKNWLTDYAKTIEVVSINTSSTISTTSINVLEDELESQSGVINQAATLTTSESEFLSKISTDINYYASKYNISIESINENTENQSAKITSDVSTRYVTVTFNNPLIYSNFYKFIKSIENNTPKMQISSIDISRSIGSDGYISVKPLTIEVYIK